jgi:hypothetical protein
MNSGGWIKGSSASRNIDPGNSGRAMTDTIVAAPATVACTSRQPRMIWITVGSRPRMFWFNDTSVPAPVEPATPGRDVEML